MIIYHITRQQDWQNAQTAGEYTADSLAQQGFLHASTREQVEDTAARFYSGQQGLVLLAIDTRRVQAEIRFDPVTLPTGETAFPHLYGPLNLDAVIRVAAFEPDSQGQFHFPEAFGGEALA